MGGTGDRRAYHEVGRVSEPKSILEIDDDEVVKQRISRRTVRAVSRHLSSRAFAGAYLRSYPERGDIVVPCLREPLRFPQGTALREILEHP